MIALPTIAGVYINQKVLCLCAVTRFLSKFWKMAELLERAAEHVLQFTEYLQAAVSGGGNARSRRIGRTLVRASLRV
jgi:hypothetical protein